MRRAADLRLIAHAFGALALMSARFWTSAAPPAMRELRRWRADAERIPDRTLRELALAKLDQEQANAYFATTFASLAPKRSRASTIEAIVALQVIYDYLDGLTEQPVTAPVSSGLELFRALSDAVSPLREPHHDYYRNHPHVEDGGYLSRLVASARGALARLPASTAIQDVAALATERCAEAQVRAHAAKQLGTTQLEHWASEHAAHEGVPWPEFAAAAASAIISVHALVAAAAESRTTPGQAARIDRFHRRSTCILATVLDGYADREEDADNDSLGYLQFFPEEAHLSARLVALVRQACQEADTLPYGGHHLMTLAGVVAYYTSALRRRDPSRHFIAPVQRELRPVITPSLAFMRTWRLGQAVIRSLKHPRNDR